MKQEYDTEFANVKFKKEDNNVIITWKKFCCYDDYRKPTTFALDLLNKYSGSNLIVDARNGFEDEKDDIEWGFSFLLPAMEKTGCKKVGFIMEKQNEIEEEMDLWTVEFAKYFAIFRDENYSALCNVMKSMIWVSVVYMVKEGLREEFYEKLKKLEIKVRSSQEPGNYRYEYSFSAESEECLLLTEVWIDQIAIDIHMKKEYFLKLQELKREYVTAVSFEKYEIKNS